MSVKNKGHLYLAYNAVMAILAIISIVLMVLDYARKINITRYPYNVVDNTILIIFAIDYFSRLVIAKNKKSFIRHNIFDLLSIIPASNIFSVFRIARIGRFLRLFKLLRIIRLVGLTGRVEQFWKMRGVLYYIYVSIAVLLITSSMFCISEKVSFLTALWWSITTATTVGYGDVSPVTMLGKLAAVIDMLIGIGLIGTVTSSLTNIFTQETDEDTNSRIDELEEQNRRLEKKIDHIEKLLEKRN